MCLTERSNLSDLFNQVIDEEMAKNESPPRSPGSNVSLEKAAGCWNSDYDSDADKSS